MSTNRFIEAVAECRKTSKWFPSPSEICKAYDQIVWNLPEPGVKLLDVSERLDADQEAERMEALKAIMAPEAQTIFIAERYKPDNLMCEKDLNVVYVPEPLKENKRRYKAGLEFITQ